MAKNTTANYALSLKINLQNLAATPGDRHGSQKDTLTVAEKDIALGAIDQTKENLS
jgi:hypothetical protein